MKPFGKKTLILVFILATALISAVSCDVMDLDGQDAVEVGSRLPEGLELPYYGVSLIVFFNPECPDCRQEMPIVQGLYEKYGKDVAFLAIGRDMTARQIGDYFKEQEFDIPFREDPKRNLYRSFARMTIPRCYLSKDGTVLRIWKDDPVMSAQDFEKEYDKIQ